MLLLMVCIKNITLNKKSILGGKIFLKIDPKMPKNRQKIQKKISFIEFSSNVLVINTIECCNIMLLLMIRIQKVTLTKKSNLGGQNIKK